MLLDGSLTARAFCDAGRVDVTAHKSLGDEYHISAFPTLMLFRHGKGIVHEGGRSKQDLSAVAHRLSRPEVGDGAADNSLREAFRASPVVFHLGSRASSALKRAFYNVARRWSHSVVFLAGGEHDVVLRREQRQEEVPLQLGPADEAELEESMENFVRENRFLILTKLDQSTFGPLSKTGRLITIGILDFSSAGFKRYRDVLQELAHPVLSPLPQSVREAMHFAYLDGNQWEPFIRRFNISPDQLPRLLVLDSNGGVYYEDSSVDEKEEMETFLIDVAEGRHPPQRQGILSVPQQIWNRFGNTWIGRLLLLGAVVGLGTIAVWVCMWVFEEDEVTPEEREQFAAVETGETPPAVGSKPPPRPARGSVRQRSVQNGTESDSAEERNESDDDGEDGERGGEHDEHPQFELD